MKTNIPIGRFAALLADVIVPSYFVVHERFAVVGGVKVQKDQEQVVVEEEPLMG